MAILVESVPYAMKGHLKANSFALLTLRKCFLPLQLSRISQHISSSLFLIAITLITFCPCLSNSCTSSILTHLAVPPHASQVFEKSSLSCRLSALNYSFYFSKSCSQKSISSFYLSKIFTCFPFKYGTSEILR